MKLAHKTQPIILGLVILLIGVGVYTYTKHEEVSYEIAKQDLIIKCEDLYDRKHASVEAERYGVVYEKADALIWSERTKSCLAYYNVPKSYDEHTFEVWDYSNTDLVLSYHSIPDNNCIENGVVFNTDNLIYKLDSKLEGNGCFLELQSKNIDLLTNFETAMGSLGFKK